jgi:hypothetical protein
VKQRDLRVRKILRFRNRRARRRSTSFVVVVVVVVRLVQLAHFFDPFFFSSSLSLNYLSPTRAHAFLYIVSLFFSFIAPFLSLCLSLSPARALFLTPSSARELRERRRRGRRGRRGRRDRKTARSSFVRSLSLSQRKNNFSDSKKKMKKRRRKKSEKDKKPKLFWPKTEKGGLLSLWVLTLIHTRASSSS